MRTPLQTTDFQLELPARGLLTLPDAAGIGIECRSGTVWLTLDHDPRDIVLNAGERFEGDVHRRALVSALEPSLVTISQARPVACRSGNAGPATRGTAGPRVPTGWSAA